MKKSSWIGISVVLVVWALLSLIVAMRVPGGSYLFTWPLLFAAGAALSGGTTRRRLVAVRGFFGYLVSQGCLVTSQAEAIRSGQVADHPKRSP